MGEIKGGINKMMRKDIKHIKGIGFDDGTDTIVKSVMESESVSYAHAVRILIRIGNDALGLDPGVIKVYNDATYYSVRM